MPITVKPHVHQFVANEGKYQADPVTYQEIWIWLFDRCNICGQKRKHVAKGKHPGRSRQVIIGIGPLIKKDSVEIVEGVNDDMAFQLNDTDKVVLTARPVDADGNPTTPTITFTGSDDAVLTITDNGDGTAVAISVAAGTATVTATATDADGATVTGTLDIEVVATGGTPPPPPVAATATVTIETGTPEAK
jgi:hypothetical protein